MIIQGQVGPLATSASISAGSQTVARYGNMGDQIVSELHGRYYEAAYRKSLFAGATQAVIATTTSAGLSTSLTGLPVLYNPIGNAYNLVLTKVGYAFLLAQPTAASIIGIATGFNPITAVSGTLTSVNPKNRFVGGPAPTGQMYFSAAITLPTVATLDTVLGGMDTGALTVSTSIPSFYDFEGGIILPPGGYLHLYTSAASLASSLLASFAWEEVPI
jgi:hypothetical protein